VDEVERALSQIADIHARVSASSRFQGFAPVGAGLTAVLALAAASAQTLWPHVLTDDPTRYVALWAGVLSLSTGVAATKAVSRARSVHGDMAETMLGATLRMLLPFAAAGVVITAAVCLLSPASSWMLPGIWQILIGLVGFALAQGLPRGIVLAAAWYFVCGAVVFGLGARSGQLSPWMMGAPFALGQIGVAFIFHRAGGDRHARP
jgi:hypothetical protein